MQPTADPLPAAGVISQMDLTFLALLCALYMGWSMGANDAANCVGADIGSGVMSVRAGIILTCLFCFFGAVLLGSHVIKTVGKGIVPLDTLPRDRAALIAFAALFGAGSWVTTATWLKFPVSTSHAIVGGVAGGGLALRTAVVWQKMGQIAVCWLVTPLGAALFGMLIYLALLRLFALPWLEKRKKPIVITLIYITSAYLAFTWGANDVANATGVLVGTGRFEPTWAALIGAVAILIGVTTWGHRVIETVGFQITNLTPVMTAGVEVGCALNVHLYTLWGIPVSTSHSIVGAIWGVGLVHGIKAINLRLARDIMVTWALTPLLSGVVSFATVKVVVLMLR